VRSVTLPPAIIGRFRSLSLERLERIEAGWVAVLQGEPDRAAEVHQELHTLKGDARVVGFNDIHLLAHKLEELLGAAERRRFKIPEEFDLVMTMAIRLMVMLLRTRDGLSLGGIDVDGFVQQIDELLADSPIRSVASTDAVPVSRRAAVPIEALDHVSPATQQRLAVAATDVFLEHLRSAGAARARLLDMWRALSRQISEFYAVPLGARVTRHQHAALRLARDLGKEVAVELSAGDLRVRADAADALDTALVHLIRNAVDHGVEPPEERARAGKPAAGRIRVHVQVVDGGGEVVVEDDGRGVNVDEVRRRAVDLGFMSRREAERAPEADLLDMLLQPGFSTRTRVSDVSGRGIGLDAVRTALARAGGKLSIGTRAGQGTTVVARVPQASRRLKVVCFPALGVDVTLAVPASFQVTAVEEDPPPSGVADPMEALDVEAGGGAREVELLLRVARESFEVTFRAGGAPYPRTAERFCPTPEDHPAEVVLLGDAEALLLRPELLLVGKRRG
jgi:two-component system chemotaxis sensor kinase CheA